MQAKIRLSFTLTETGKKDNKIVTAYVVYSYI